MPFDRQIRADNDIARRFQLYLEAPDDIQCFQFSPTDSHVIAGGCVNGQVIMWDIKSYEERIRNPRGDHRDKDLFIVKSSTITGVCVTMAHSHAIVHMCLAWLRRRVLFSNAIDSLLCRIQY
jgi:dynein intermediate chain 3, axonemal